MLIIRLQRVGRRNDPSFRVVVTEKKGPPKGKYLEKVGTYDVRRGNVVFNKERVLYWISKGSQPSPTVHNLLISSGIIEGKKIPKHKKVIVAEATQEPVTVSATEAQTETIEPIQEETKVEEVAPVEAETKAEEPSTETIEPAQEDIIPASSEVEQEKPEVSEAPVEGKEQ
ncbi:MAG: 30S ribosomal protein S16 [Candidatus Terrybacteria bacterium RIFCSPLOWO2_01_FULL_44_24]|uniref:Small ribosomal subunit protein bS16 n=1 Tax=Candidatus Terrybacteria bacterium RIFCSPHIGHO2_01_FULL_43_35 TaxID=1802361 RepID=A0A1G2PDS6_9BACT|nr:MAG: 30S ribosomal protein S16 [Candidatus Terrybacteria bacterium RIFCSPHIGHO2_01_FULL_43_35]OHA49607.1 MAG: 30S ribosomal protein S16 [Candidatus Terrybacteria bacterium RIFCSPHIGHO2_02_FULL_43_14]OHA51493.1 MAG: 30S ribosomal protein S16 [Candidatus Terrybacteria bacterium RIFCSPLOWO2_01_FULL_44_24]